MRAWLIILALAGPVFADSIKLKSGGVVEGTIVGETETEYSIEVSNARGTVFSTETVLKSDVVEAKRVTAAEKRAATMAQDWLRLETLLPGPDSGNSTAAADAALTKLKAFLEDYPDSPFAGTVAERIKVWQAERDKLAAGQRRLDSTWMTAEEYDRASKSDRARVLIQEGRQAMIDRKWNEAARAYDGLLALQPGGATEEVARRQLAIALFEWRKLVEPVAKSGQVVYAAAKARVEKAGKEYQQAREAVKSAPASGTQTGKLGDGGAAFAKAQERMTFAYRELVNARAELEPVEVRAKDLQQQLANIGKVTARHALETLVAEVANPPPPTAVSTPSGSQPTGVSGTSDVLDDTHNWWERNWLMLAGIGIVCLLILAWIVNR